MAERNLFSELEEETIPADWPEWIRRRDDPSRAHAKPEALDDLLVLDVSRGSLAGCICSSILAEFGAEVIRMEPPGGDLVRKLSPFGIMHQGTGLGYLVEGHNKLHTTLNLETAEGRAILVRLAARADVVIETFAPGQMDAWGIGYRQLSAQNPGLIYVALSTYGQFGPEAEKQRRKPHREVADQALSGIVYVTGEMQSGPEPQPHEVPTKAGNWLGWYAAGAWASFGTLTALRYRGQTGRGQMLDVTGTEGIMRFMEDQVTWYEKAGKVRERIGLLDTSVFPYTFVRTKDGFTMIAGFSDVNFQALTTIMGRPELREHPQFKTFIDRLQLENKKVLHAEVEKWSLNYTSDEILAKVQDYVLNKHGPGIVATGRVNSPSDALGEDNWWERGILTRVEDSVYGELLLQQPPWKMTETPARIKWACRPVGADNRLVYLKYLGYGPKKLGELAGAGVI